MLPIASINVGTAVSNINNQLPPMMQTQKPMVQFGKALWNQTASFADPMMLASYN